MLDLSKDGSLFYTPSLRFLKKQWHWCQQIAASVSRELLNHAATYLELVQVVPKLLEAFLERYEVC